MTIRSMSALALLGLTLSFTMGCGSGTTTSEPVKKDSKDKKPTADAKGNKGKGSKEKDNTPDPVTPTGGSGAINLEGTWMLIGTEAQGEKFTPKEIERMPEASKKVEFTADKMISAAAKDGAPYKLDTSKSPITIDITGKNFASYGIVKLEGDTLTMCVGASAADRPKEFTTMKGSRVMVQIYKKQ